jgi:hypothetical protein
MACLMADGGGHSLSPSLGEDELHHQDPLRPEQGLVLWWLAHSAIALPPAQ